MKRIFWNDLETTGTEPGRHGVIQIAGAIETEEGLVEEFNLKMKPFKGDLISKEALAVNGVAMDEISTFMDPLEAYQKLNCILDRHGFRKNKAKRYIPGGYNNQFDLQFLSAWYEKCSGGPYAFWDHLQFQPIDPYPVLVCLWRAGIIETKDCKLETMCKHFGIALANAHDAMADIRATIALTKKVIAERIFSSWTGSACNMFGRIKP